MAALTTDTTRALKGARVYSYKIANASQLYVGSFASMLAGYLQPFAGAAGEALVGRTLPTPNSQLTAQLLGNTSPASGVQVPEASVCLEDEILINVAVTGVTAQTDVGSVVYLNATDNDITLTRPARGMPFGRIVRWYSSTSCDVHRFGKEALDAISLAGNGADLMFLGNFDAPNLAAGDVIKATVPYRYRVRSVYAVVAKALAGGTSLVFTFKKNSTAFTTGGVLTLNTTGGTGGTVGDKVAATAITQDSTTVLSESDTLTGTVAVSGTFTADTGGNFNVFAILDKQLGI